MNNFLRMIILSFIMMGITSCTPEAETESPSPIVSSTNTSTATTSEGDLSNPTRVPDDT